MTGNESSAADSKGSCGEDSHRDRLMREAAILWALAADQCRWGLAFDAAETRRLALGKRVQAILADALFTAGAVREMGS